MTITNITVANLGNFYGTETYTRHGLGKRNIVLTDGTKFLVENDAGWLLDAIVSHQTDAVRKGSTGFQSWTLTRGKTGKNSVTLTCTDGNKKVLVVQEIEYSDFPLHEWPEGFQLFCEEGSVNGRDIEWICMLPSER